VQHGVAAGAIDGGFHAGARDFGAVIADEVIQGGVIAELHDGVGDVLGHVGALSDGGDVLLALVVYDLQKRLLIERAAALSKRGRRFQKNGWRDRASGRRERPARRRTLFDNSASTDSCISAATSFRTSSKRALSRAVRVSDVSKKRSVTSRNNSRRWPLSVVRARSTSFAKRAVDIAGSSPESAGN
jgi:hypothetical protein